MVSLSGNILKISTVDKGEFQGVSAEIAKEVIDGDKILNLEDFAVALKDLVGQVTQKSERNLLLNFIAEPGDVFLNFIAVNKNDGDVEEQILKEISTKVKDASLDEMYFSYLKIAPFVYQFIGIEKELLDRYIEISNLVGIGLKSVTPWVLFLPKFVEINDPAIFISKIADRQFVVLSEFGGVFFSDVYETDKSTEELQKTVEELSVFKRTNPISKVYLYNYDSFSLNPDFNILQLEIPNSDLEEAKGYEMHLLINYMIKKDKSILASQVNLLNLLPVPVVVENKNRALVTVAALTLVILAGIGGGLFLLNRSKSRVILENIAQNDRVLSDVAGSEENQAAEVPKETEEVVEEVLLREDISVRILNGAGIQGVAGRTQKFMEGLGYKVEGVDNADEIGRQDTLLKIKPEKAKYNKLLTEDMQDFFSTTVEEDLGSEEPYDVLVIIGTDAKI